MVRPPGGVLAALALQRRGGGPARGQKPRHARRAKAVVSVAGPGQRCPRARELEGDRPSREGPGVDPGLWRGGD